MGGGEWDITIDMRYEKQAVISVLAVIMSAVNVGFVTAIFCIYKDDKEKILLWPRLCALFVNIIATVFALILFNMITKSTSCTFIMSIFVGMCALSASTIMLGNLL